MTVISTTERIFSPIESMLGIGLNRTLEEMHQNSVYNAEFYVKSCRGNGGAFLGLSRCV